METFDREERGERPLSGSSPPEGESYQAIIRQIFTEWDGESHPIEARDGALFSAIESQERDIDPEYDKRNRLYTDLLKHYIGSYKSKSRWKRWYKCVYFVVVVLVFLCIVLYCLDSIRNISLKNSSSLADVGVTAGGFGAILSAILVIPKIIAEHLFPSNEDANMIDMVKNMQLNDSGIRSWLHPRKGKK